jgi:undecaprenyl-diphosphatase
VVTATGRGVIFVNPTAGDGHDVAEFSKTFAGHEIVECKPDELEDRLRAALAADDDVAFVGVAGGDGSIRCAVEVLLVAAPTTPLLAIPAGTRNHFARDLGIDDIETAAAVADTGHTRTIDVGSVNDAPFVNNSSIGAYPRLVAHREARETHLPKGLAAVVAAWHQLRRGRRIRVAMDGTELVAWAVFVGNNCYGDSLRELTGRERLDQGVLDIRVAHADRRLSRLRIVGAVLFGRTASSPLIDRRRARTVQLELMSSADPEVALDGEVTTMHSPLLYESLPHALVVLTPE